MFIKKEKDLRSLDDESLHARLAELDEKIENSNRMGMLAGVVVAGALIISVTTMIAPLMLGAIASAVALFAGKLAYEGECREETRRLTAVETLRSQQKLEQQAAAFANAAAAPANDPSVLQAPTTVNAPLQLKKNPAPGP